MRRILLGALLVTLFASCSKSLEDKANTLIEEDIKKTLYHPETYDPAETQVDSAFTPFDDPVFYEKTINIPIDYHKIIQRVHSAIHKLFLPIPQSFAGYVQGLPA